jgi:hypothetical protein
VPRPLKERAVMEEPSWYVGGREGAGGVKRGGVSQEGDRAGREGDKEMKGMGEI